MAPRSCFQRYFTTPVVSVIMMFVSIVLTAVCVGVIMSVFTQKGIDEMGTQMAGLMSERVRESILSMVNAGNRSAQSLQWAAKAQPRAPVPIEEGSSPSKWGKWHLPLSFAQNSMRGMRTVTMGFDDGSSAFWDINTQARTLVFNLLEIDPTGCVDHLCTGNPNNSTTTATTYKLENADVLGRTVRSVFLDARTQGWHQAGTTVPEMDFIWSRLRVTPQDPGVAVLSVIFSLYNRTHGHLGVGAVEMEIDAIEAIVDEGRPTENSHILVVDNEGRVVATSTSRVNYYPEGCSSTDMEVNKYMESTRCLPTKEMYPPAREMQAQGHLDGRFNGVRSAKLELEGETYYTSVSDASAEFEGLGWKILVLVPEKDVMRHVRDGIKWSAIVSVIIVVVIIVCFAISIRMLHRPLQEVVEKLKSAAYLYDDPSGDDTASASGFTSADMSYSGDGGEVAGGASTKKSSGTQKSSSKSNASSSSRGGGRNISVLGDIASIQLAYWSMADELKALKGYIPEHVRDKLVATKLMSANNLATSSISASTHSRRSTNSTFDDHEFDMRSLADVEFQERANEGASFGGDEFMLQRRRPLRDDSCTDLDEDGNNMIVGPPLIPRFADEKTAGTFEDVSPLSSDAEKIIKGDAFGPAATVADAAGAVTGAAAPSAPGPDRAAVPPADAFSPSSPAEGPSESDPSPYVGNTANVAHPNAAAVTDDEAILKAAPNPMSPLPTKVGSTAATIESKTKTFNPAEVSVAAEQEMSPVQVTADAAVGEADAEPNKAKHVSIALPPDAEKNIKQDSPATPPTKYVGDNLLEERLVTVVVINIIGFHEYMSHTSNHKIANEHTVIVNYIHDVAKRCGGVLDNFAGDHFWVSFNAATDCEDGPIAAALFACEVVSVINGEAMKHHKSQQTEVARRSRGGMLPPLARAAARFAAALRGATVGIATGRAHVGSLGSSKIRRHTILSAAVSEASALERLAGRYPDCGVVIGEDMMAAIEGYCQFLILDAILLPGTGGQRRRIASLKGAMQGLGATFTPNRLRHAKAFANPLPTANPYEAANLCFDSFLNGDAPQVHGLIQKLSSEVAAAQTRRLELQKIVAAEERAAAQGGKAERRRRRKSGRNASEAATALRAVLTESECSNITFVTQLLATIVGSVDGRTYRSPLGMIFEPR